MPSHARTRSARAYGHQGAQSARLPRSVNPRLTRRVLGIRVTPRAHEGFLGGLACAVLLVGSSTLPDQLVTALFG